MNEGRRIALYSLSPEAEGKTEYASPDIASYITYCCAYCMEKFYLVDPYTQRSGGCAQRLNYRNRKTNEAIPTNEVHGLCISCFHDIMQRQQQDRNRH